MQGATSGGLSTDFTEQHMVIWGTDVVVERCQKNFTKFLQKFTSEQVDDDETRMDTDIHLPFYMSRLDEVTLRFHSYFQHEIEHI